MTCGHEPKAKCQRLIAKLPFADLSRPPRLAVGLAVNCFLPQRQMTGSPAWAGFAHAGVERRVIIEPTSEDVGTIKTRCRAPAGRHSSGQLKAKGQVPMANCYLPFANLSRLAVDCFLYPKIDAK